MRPILPLTLALTLTLAAGCARHEPEPTSEPAAESQPAAEPQPAGHPALNKLNETKKKLGEIDQKRREEQRAAEGEAAGQNP